MQIFRPAIESDAEFIVSLIGESSGGVWPAIWDALAFSDESISASGARYIRDPNNLLNISNTLVCEIQGKPAGVMICYQEAAYSRDSQEKEASEVLPKELVRALRPYQELSDPNSLFIAEICFLPQFRGQGLGTAFLEKAVALAQDRSLPRLSLRVFSENSGAVRLYKRFGFKQSGQRPIIHYPGLVFSGSALLMTYSVPA